MKYLEDSRLTQLTSDLTGAFLNTRGSGNGAGGSSHVGLIKNSTRGCKGKKKNEQQQQQQRSSSGGTGSGAVGPRKNKQGSPAAYYAYNPVGYSSGGGASSSASYSSGGGSCRAIYGRVEAYTTKRAGSDKRTAFEVGERYAHEMERFNEAVEALKRKHALERRRLEEEKDEKETSGGNSGDEEGGEKEAGGRRSKKKIETRRQRSRSLDGVVTFAASVAPSDDAADNALATLEEGVVAPAEEMLAQSQVKRGLPMPEGILKRPSSNKRCRATSFDVSTGPSTIVGSSPRRYDHCESSSSLLAGSAWGSAVDAGGGIRPLPLSVVHPTIPSVNSVEDDRKVHTLIPQPSLYQSSLSEHDQSVGSNGDKKASSLPAMVPRRLVTDLILTLNASFPDYDFGEAQVSDFVTLSTTEAVRRINSKLGEFASTTDAGCRDFLPRFWNSLDDVLGGLGECEVYSYAPQEGRSTGEDDPLEFLTMSMAVDNGAVGDEKDGDARGVVESAAASGDGIIDAPEAPPVVVFSPSGGGRIVSSDDFNGSGGDLDAAAMALDLPDQIISPSSGQHAPHVTLWSMNYFFVSRNKKRIVLFACVQTVRTPRGNYEDYDDERLLEKYDNEYDENNLVFDEARREDENKEDEYYGGTAAMESTSYQFSREIGSPSSGKTSKAQFSMSLPTGDSESVSVMVEDTDFEYDEQGVDVDGEDVDQAENDFDTGTLSVPSQVA